MPIGLCALRILAACVLPTTSSAFGARIVSGTNLHRMERCLRGSVPKASKRQSRSINLGLPGPLFGKATQGTRNASCLGGWRCKGPSKEADRRRLKGTASRNTSRSSGRSLAFGVVVKDGQDWMTAAKSVGM